jgi:hypothetical protein
MYLHLRILFFRTRIVAFLLFLWHIVIDNFQQSPEINILLTHWDTLGDSRAQANMYFPFYGLILSNDRICVRAIIHGWLMRYLSLELLERGGGGCREVNTPHNPSKGERCKGGGGAAVNKATVTCKTSVGI